MSFWPGEKLRYAETHFKFRLPWSLLYRPWPEIIFDMPFQAVPGIEPTMWIVVRDADRFQGGADGCVVFLPQGSEKAGMRIAAQGNQVVDADAAGLGALRQHDSNAGGKLFGRVVTQRQAVDAHFSVQGRQQSAERFQKRGFTGAVAAQQAGQFAREELQVQPRMHRMPSASAGVAD